MLHKSTRISYAAFSLSVTISLFTSVLAGCSSGSSASSSSGSSTSSFSVASVKPASGTTQVATNSTIQITFSSAAEASTVNGTDIQVTDSKPITGTVSYNSTSNMATFTPSSALVAGSTYTVKVTGVMSSAGTAMASAFTSTFITAAATTTQATVQYQGTLFPMDQNSGGGQVSVDTAGGLTIQLTGAKASTTYSAQFCPSYSIYTQQPYACIALGNVTTDAGGDSTVATQFPQAGEWAGEFELNTGTTLAFETGMTSPSDPGGSTQVYTAALQPETTVNGKGDGGTGTQTPLTSGSVTYSAGSLQFTLTGASPNTAYTSTEAGVLGGSSSYLLYNSQNQSGFTTNASGDVTFTVLQDGTAGDIFLVDSNTAAGFVGGFSVPAS